MREGPLLEVAGLDAAYGDFQALFGISLQIDAGEVVAIIGANGAGKSTLLRAVTGLIASDEQQIRYKGEAIGARSAFEVAALGIAMVPEGRQLFRSLSVEENLVLGGQLARPGRWDLEAVYSLFPVLKERRSHGSTELSGGQQQMVAIGRALMANPDLLLLDEISLGLAPIIIKDIYDALPSIVGEGMSAIIVEQDISRAIRVSNRLYCLQEGRVSLHGTSDDVSRDAVTQAYFGM